MMKIEVDEKWLEKAQQLANDYAHVYSFVGDESMPCARDALFEHLFVSTS
jgi:hypothetical protein